MAYTKQTFTSGQTLKASDLNTMSQGIKDLDDGKQEKLVSGTSLKTINGQSLLGSGNIVVKGGGDVIVNGATLNTKYVGLYGKTVSFIGDSITTFRGYNPEGYATWYPSGGINSVDQTWWKQFLDTAGLTLLVNAAWSGCCVARPRSGSIPACNMTRINALGNDVGTAPDIVVTLIGINDFSSKVPVGEWDADIIPEEQADSTASYDTFSEAYALMVANIMRTYPNAEVFCATIMETPNRASYDSSDTTEYPTAFKNSDGTLTTVTDYNRAIRRVAESFGAKVIDMHSCGIHYFNGSTLLSDNLHPNATGAKLMAKKALADVSAKSIHANPLGIASAPDTEPDTPVTYYKVTYKYVDVAGNTVKSSTTNSVAANTVLSLSTNNAPTVSGYKVVSVSPSSVTVTSDVTVTFTYEALPQTVYHTVTYVYVDGSGTTIRDNTTQQVAEGTVLTIDNAPTVDGYSIKSVSPETVTVTGNVTITATYGVTTNEWYTDLAKYAIGSSSQGVSSFYGFSYRDNATVNACVGKPINAIRMVVGSAGKLTYGKVSATSFDTLGTIMLTNPSKQVVQTYTIPEVTLATGERMWFGTPSDSGLFYYDYSATVSAGFMYTKVTAANLAGALTLDKNIAVDLGYVS